MLISNRANREGPEHEQAAPRTSPSSRSSSWPCSSSSTTYWQTWAGPTSRTGKDNSSSRSRSSRSTAASIVAGRHRPREEPQAPQGARPHDLHAALPAERPRAAGDRLRDERRATTTGLEQSLDDYLTGANTNLSNTLKQTLDKLGGKTVHGDDVILTLRPDIQRLALDQLAGRCGAVVVLDAKTGAVLAMASSPTYNANLMVQPNGYDKIEKIKGTCGDASALVNNATAGLYPPGSTFKMVTAAAALDSGAYTPSSRFDDPGYCVEYGQHVSNAGNPDQNGPEAFGNVSLAAGLRALDQLGLLQHRQAHRGRGDPRVREAVRLLLAAAARDAVRASAWRPASTRTGKLFDPDERVSDRSGAARVRPVQHARHAAADGDGGADDRERRRGAEAVPRRSHRRARRQPRHPDDAADRSAGRSSRRPRPS